MITPNCSLPWCGRELDTPFNFSAALVCIHKGKSQTDYTIVHKIGIPLNNWSDKNEKHLPVATAANSVENWQIIFLLIMIWSTYQQMLADGMVRQCALMAFSGCLSWNMFCNKDYVPWKIAVCNEILNESWIRPSLLSHLPMNWMRET